MSNINIGIDLNTSKAQHKLLFKQKDKIEKEYHEAGRTISQQQRKLTETIEIVKTMESLRKIYDEIRATDKSADSS